MTDGKVRNSNDPFKVPENYFQNLEDRLAEAALNADAEEQVVKTPIIDLLKPYIAMAASIVIVFGVLYSPLKRYTENMASNSDAQENLLELELGQSMYHDALYASAQATVEESLITDEMIEDMLLESVSDYELIEYAQNDLME